MRQVAARKLFGPSRVSNLPYAHVPPHQMMPLIRARVSGVRRGPLAHRRRSGFTLIEILVVIVVIAILATLVAPNIFQHVGAAKSATAKSQIEMLGAALDAYRLDNGRYPTPNRDSTRSGKSRRSIRRRTGARRISESRCPSIRGDVPTTTCSPDR